MDKIRFAIAGSGGRMGRMLIETVLAAPDAKVVYSVDSLSADARKSSGVASYVQSLDEAKKSMKAGDKPLVLKATKATGTDLQLDPADALKLLATNAGFLAEGRVIIVTN